MSKPIQEQFGAQVIDVFAAFARADLKTPAQLEADEFSHVTDDSLRMALAQVLYGVRWIYKLGPALLTKDEERAAHVRAQIVDYASVCEGLLSYCVAHAIRTNATEYRSPAPANVPRQDGLLESVEEGIRDYFAHNPRNEAVEGRTSMTTSTCTSCPTDDDAGSRRQRLDSSCAACSRSAQPQLPEHACVIVDRVPF